jgi:hypothetical protein
MAWVSGVLGDAASLPQAPFRVDVLDGWEHVPNDGLAVVDGAIPVPGRDATGQGALDGGSI